jgi:uncharacterized protein (DUF58 family)
MWFYPLLLILVLLAVAGAIFMGGVYTLVLVPLVLVALASTLGYALWTRSQTAVGGDEEAGRKPGRPLPHQRRREPGHVTAAPERLVDARRQQQ